MDSTVPTSVRIATAFYLVSLVVLAVSSVLAPTSSPPPAASAIDRIIGITVVVAILVVVPTIFLLSKILRRRNWARLVLAGWTLVGLVAYGLETIRTMTEAALSSAPGIIESVFEIVALVLLFTPASNGWFRVSKTPESPSN